VAEHFSRKGNTVIVLDNLSRAQLLGQANSDGLQNWSYLKQYSPEVQLVKGDIRSVETIDSVAKEAELIVHTAAQVAVTTSLIDPKTDFEINAGGTLNVLEAARKNDSTLIFCSTNKVYGENVNSIPVEEEETRYEYADPRFKNGIPEDFSIDHTNHSPYGCSKLAADLYAQDYAHTYGTKTGVFRLSCVYGRRQYGVEDQGWVAWFIRAILGHVPLTIYGTGKQVRDILWIDDLVRAIDLFSLGPLNHEVFNIGGGANNRISILELLALLRRITGGDTRVTFSDWRKADQRVYVSDLTKAYEKMAWKPTTDPISGLSKLVDWTRSYLKIESPVISEA
jgi:CDP-paratose 2-epimerase